jgi:hypothetical protein
VTQAQPQSQTHAPTGEAARVPERVHPESKGQEARGPEAKGKEKHPEKRDEKKEKKE